jgi:large subunit ribosomal protein L7A
MPKRLALSRKKCTGCKQTLRAVEAGQALLVYIADDAEARFVAAIAQAASARAIEIVRVPTMEQLGKACGIEVGAAAAALLAE